MKFKEFEYRRPDFMAMKNILESSVESMNSAASFEDFIKGMDEVNKIRNNIQSMETLVSIRYSINTDDDFYKSEKEYWDEISPQYEELNSLFYRAVTESRFRDELEKKVGKQFMKIAEYALRAFDPCIIEELKEENRLSSEYTRLLASAKIMFEGEERNLSAMGPFMTAKDRYVREEASRLYYGFFEENEARFDELFDKLVSVRHSMALKLGFESFTELGYIRMMRTDYDAEMVSVFRSQVSEHIVPSASKLFESQRKRLGLDSLRYFDENFEFETGNAEPKGDAQFIIDGGIRMYSELSPETKEFFEFMMEHELMDLETRKGKGAGGYCTYIPDYKAPFIFSNFNSTDADIDVLTHEAGHAFQVYQSRDYKIPEYLWPTYEACEIHSMSMEFLTWPWMELFFEDDTEKYKFIHLSESLLFIPYGVTVDEFQHWVYENPEASPSERRQKWLEIEGKYLPTRDYGEVDDLKEGIFWFRQGHIFSSPFYYIDYTLAQVCAFQFWIKANEDREKAWKEYLDLCRLGGSRPFFALMEAANLKNPFTEGTIASVIPPIREFLNSIDDTGL